MLEPLPSVHNQQCTFASDEYQYKAGNKEMLRIYNDNLHQDLKMVEDNKRFTAGKKDSN